jgi:ABC-2 type transport system ATP-binding protein
VSDSVVLLDGVSKRFGSVLAVDNLSISVPRGTVYGFLGPNGAGKTTSIRMLVGILRPKGGSVTVLGENDPSVIKRRLGYLPEEKGLYKKMRVAELVSYFGRLKGMSRRDAITEAHRLLEEFDLNERANDKCESLSKGLGQKVQIACTLVHKPELIVLDEPFSGLDPVNVELVRRMILDLKRDNRTVIISTHVMEQAEQICDALVLINRGKKVLEGPIADLKQRAERTIVVDYDGDGAALNGLPGVHRVNDAGKHAELALAVDADPQAILAQLLPKLRIRRFDTREASLHEIFVRAVGPDQPNGSDDVN